MGKNTREEGAMQRKSPRKLLGIPLSLLLNIKLHVHVVQLHKARQGKTTGEL